MTTLKDLIDRLTLVGRCLSSADIPVRINGGDFDIDEITVDAPSDDDGTAEVLFVNLKINQYGLREEIQ